MLVRGALLMEEVAMVSISKIQLIKLKKKIVLLEVDIFAILPLRYGSTDTACRLLQFC